MNRWQKVYEAGEKGDLAYLKEAYTYKYVDLGLNTETLFRAVQNNHIECVAFLLPLSDLRVERGEILNGSTGLILQAAVRNNNYDMVEVLLPYCNPLVENSLALQYASAAGFAKIFDLLYPLSNPTEALKSINERIALGYWSHPTADLLKAQMQRDTLVSHLPSNDRNTSRKL